MADQGWQSEDTLVTGEAVTLDLPAASIGPRVVSGLIDLLSAFVSLFFLGWFFLNALDLASRFADEALFSAVVLVTIVLVVLGIPVATETLTRGKTLGKRIMGLRTVRDDAGPITFRHALARGLVGVVEIYLFQGAPALITALVSPKGKRLGDLAAGTYVIRERVKVTVPPPAQMPAPLARWAATADIATLPDGLAAAMRRYLTAGAEITPQARAALGQGLVTDTLRYVAPPPPAGSTVDQVLAAVLAERRHRDSLRLERDEAARRRVLPRVTAR